MSMTKESNTLSTRALTIKDSITMAITAKANQLRQEGKKILSFSAGEPDFDTPDNIKKATINALNAGKTKYTPAAGINELKDAIIEKLKADNQLDYKRENIVVSCGAKHSIYNVLLAIINEGDEVIVPSPYWVSYPDQCTLVGGQPVIVECSDEEGFKISPEKLEAAITPKTKLLILNSPSNPTGAVYTQEELAALAEVIIKHDIFVLSDEIYEHLIYDAEKHISIASINDAIKTKSIVINGVSKAYSMTGWRIGYTAAPADIAKAMGKMQSQTTSNPTSIAQWASIEAIAGPQDAVHTMNAAFEKRRTIMVDGLNAIDGITCLNPKGAFYTFPNISGVFGKSSATGPINSAADFCKNLLEEALVACVPGSGFGADKHIRLSYATSEADIKEGLQRIETFVKGLR